MKKLSILIFVLLALSTFALAEETEDMTTTTTTTTNTTTDLSVAAESPEEQAQLVDSANPEPRKVIGSDEKTGELDSAEAKSEDAQATTTKQELQNKGEQQQIKVQETVQSQAKNVEELKQMVQQKTQEMEQEMTQLEKDEEKVYQNQNTVRLAVHTMLAMKEMTGGIGEQVSEIAKHFNNSVQITMRAEEQIEKRSALARLFAGGDAAAAEKIEGEVTQNQEKLQELKQLRTDCDCGEAVKSMIQEQIQTIEQEQERLSGLAQAEKKSKGLLGWIWK